MAEHCRQCMTKTLRIRELEAEVERLRALEPAIVEEPANDEIREVFEAWQRDCDHPRAQLTDSKRRKIRARLREKPVRGQTRKDDLLMAIKGAAYLAYVDPNTGVRYDGIETIFGNAEKVELNLKRYDAAEKSRRRDEGLERKLVGA